MKHILYYCSGRGLGQELSAIALVSVGFDVDVAIEFALVFLFRSLVLLAKLALGFCGGGGVAEAYPGFFHVFLAASIVFP